MGTIDTVKKTKGRTKTLARRFGRSERGATVVEFAIVGPIFFALVGATMETALAFFAGYALDAAVIDTSRLIRTGQEPYISSADDYRAALCGRLYGIFDCNELRVSVSTIGNFAAFDMSSPIDQETGAWTMENAPYSRHIDGDQTVVIEAYYKWPSVVNIPGLAAGLTGDGKRLLAATHVFKTEPYS